MTTLSAHTIAIRNGPTTRPFATPAIPYALPRRITHAENDDVRPAPLSPAARTHWTILAVVLSIALHGLVIWNSHSHHGLAEVEPITPVQVPPMTIQLTRPAPPAPSPPVAQPAPPVPAKSNPAPRRPAAPSVPAAIAPAPAQAAAVARSEVGESTPNLPTTSALPAPPAPVQAAPEAVTPPIGRAGYLNNPAPTYPSFAQRRGWEGSVLLRVHVLAGGTPDNVQIATSSGRDLLDQAAINAVKTWTFIPAKRGQTPVDGWVTVPIDFTLAK